MPETFRQLLEHAPGLLDITGDTTITAPVAESSSDVQRGGIFVARRGLSVDGHDFIPQAIERGAAAVVGEKAIKGLSVPYARVENAQEATGYLAAAYHHFPSRKLVIIGVTGTDGKTTTSTLIHSILQEATGRKAGLISTVSADLGNTTVDTGFHVTTPSAPMIQSLLAQMVENGLTHCVLEMTSHGLAQGRLNGVDLDIAVLTNLTHEHLDYHGTFENYRAAKARMFEMLAVSQSPRKAAVVNGDDPNAPHFIEAAGNARIITYGLSETVDYQAVDIEYGSDGTRFNIADHVKGELHSGFFTPLIGEFNVRNCLAAIETAFLFGLYSGAVYDGIARVKAIPGRMERIYEGQDFIAIVDFAHTPNALKNALFAARTMVSAGGRLIVAFGSAGLRDREKRRLMPGIAIEFADFSIFTAEDPRTESLDAILQTMADAAAAAGGVEGEHFIRVRDRGEALYRACQMAKAGDVVIACGKGHEQSMAFGTIEYAWDDREALRAALRGQPLQTLPTANNP